MPPVVNAKVKSLDGQRLLFDGEVVRYCGRCGRRLKSEASQRRRLGPTCARRCRAESTTETTDASE